MNIAKEILNKIENTIIIVAGDGPLLNKMIEMAKKYRIYNICNIIKYNKILNKIKKIIDYGIYVKINNNKKVAYTIIHILLTTLLSLFIR